MRYTSKERLLEDMQKEYHALRRSLNAIAPPRFREPGVWGDSWTVHDLIAHLAAWHRLFLSWYAAGLRGENPQLPAPGFKWNDLGRLNRAIQAQYRDSPTESVWADFENSHAEILDVVQRSSEAELFEPGRFSWTRDHGLVTYVAGNTSSHYRFAQKVLRRWLKEAGRVESGAGSAHQER